MPAESNTPPNPSQNAMAHGLVRDSPAPTTKSLRFGDGFAIQAPAYAAGSSRESAWGLVSRLFKRLRLLSGLGHRAIAGNI
jgi:hypothetical protein